MLADDAQAADTAQQAQAGANFRVRHGGPHQAENSDADEQVALDHAQGARQHVARVLQVQGDADQGEADGGNGKQGGAGVGHGFL